MSAIIAVILRGLVDWRLVLVEADFLDMDDFALARLGLVGCKERQVGVVGVWAKVPSSEV
ncbi:hypothetical protein [Nostoc sp.]|uniref:hypothetical protein n=1 Tax=Nostoc sp. TaxID=1180 RepID=UPI002FF5B0F4